MVLVINPKIKLLNFVTNPKIKSGFFVTDPKIVLCLILDFRHQNWSCSFYNFALFVNNV